MPVFALSDMTQRAHLFLTAALLAFGVEACGSDSNGALFGDSQHGNRNTGGSGSAAAGGKGDAAGANASGGRSGNAAGGTAQGGTMGGSGGIAPVTSGGTPAAGGAKGGSAGSSGGTAASGGNPTGGKPDTGGAGGDPVPDGGSGGEVDAGRGTGGAAPDSGDGTGGVPNNAKIRCGEMFCDKSAGQLCCVKEAMQRTTAACAPSAQGCVHVFRCDSDSDCARGEHCCMEFQTASNTPSTSCAKQCDSPISCSVPEDCQDGQSCCGVVIPSPTMGVRYGSVACQDKCGQDTPFCIDNSACSNNTSCQQSQTLPPGYLVCRQ